jgi:hypothetical protein
MMKTLISQRGFRISFGMYQKAVFNTDPVTGFD